LLNVIKDIDIGTDYIWPINESARQGNCMPTNQPKKQGKARSENWKVKALKANLMAVGQPLI
jgi:hypothetical protein